jgi:hypothetical protein
MCFALFSQLFLNPLYWLFGVSSFHSGPFTTFCALIALMLAIAYEPWLVREGLREDRIVRSKIDNRVQEANNSHTAIYGDIHTFVSGPRSAYRSDALVRGQRADSQQPVTTPTHRVVVESQKKTSTVRRPRRAKKPEPELFRGHKGYGYECDFVPKIRVKAPKLPKVDLSFVPKTNEYYMVKELVRHEPFIHARDAELGINAALFYDWAWKHRGEEILVRQSKGKRPIPWLRPYVHEDQKVAQSGHSVLQAGRWTQGNFSHGW